MAVAKKCDRCGKLYEEYNGDNGVCIVHIPKDSERSQHDGFNFKNPRDLCPDCMSELISWIKHM